MIIGRLKELASQIYWWIISVWISSPLNRDKYIVIEAYLTRSGFSFKKHNWGDDINKFMFEFVTHKRVFNIPFTVKNITPRKNTYSLIGSILNFYNLDNKIIYGSGVIDPQMEILGIPDNVISVRGPKTRDLLLSKGICCPPKYGDPVLLLPIFYKGSRIKSEKVGFIINMGTNKPNTIIHKLSEKYELAIISMTEYDVWTDVIDQIIECKFILSESLHGLIIAETYGIPNVWIECQDHPSYWNFKFEDYYASIDKEESILRLQYGVHFDRIDKKVCCWNKGKIDYDELLSLFPFDIECENYGRFLNNE